DVPNEHRATRHPLVVGPPPMVVRAIEPGFRKAIDQPPEDRLVPNVHAERDLGLLPVASERPLAHYQADKDPPVVVRKRRHAKGSTPILFHRREKRETRRRLRVTKARDNRLLSRTPGQAAFCDAPSVRAIPGLFPGFIPASG